MKKKDIYMVPRAQRSRKCPPTEPSWSRISSYSRRGCIKTRDIESSGLGVNTCRYKDWSLVYLDGFSFVRQNIFHSWVNPKSARLEGVGWVISDEVESYVPVLVSRPFLESTFFIFHSREGWRGSRFEWNRVILVMIYGWRSYWYFMFIFSEFF